MIPHVAPPSYPDGIRQGRLAATFVLNTPELETDPAQKGLLTKCSIALLGIPDDTGVSMNHGRPGAAMGPAALRAALARYGVSSPMDGPRERPAYPKVFDAGDVVPGRTLEETHQRVTQATAALLDRDLFPIAIGGGHDITFPFVRAVSQRFGVLDGVWFDAHLDVRPEAGSGMSFRALLDGGHVRRAVCVGADELSNSREHLEYLVSKGGLAKRFAPEQWQSVVLGEHQFVSLDLDVLDMAFAPGVSAMNPCGMSPEQLGAYVDAAGRNPAVRCFDIMELSPPHDESGRTARLAAHMLTRFLRALGSRGLVA